MALLNGAAVGDTAHDFVSDRVRILVWRQLHGYPREAFPARFDYQYVPFARDVTENQTLRIGKDAGGLQETEIRTRKLILEFQLFEVADECVRDVFERYMKRRLQRQKLCRESIN